MTETQFILMTIYYLDISFSLCSQSINEDFASK